MDYYGKIENPEGLPDNCQEIIQTKLISGKTITLPVWLQGGGQQHKKYFLTSIGDKKYKNAFEWCAGHGEIGFELITAGVCETMSFSDMHPKSAEWCLKNASDLNLSEKISAFTSSTISGIQTPIKWDLVVGNPPNSIGIDHEFLADMRSKDFSEDHILLYARTTWDLDFKTHTEFFKNIGAYTTDDVDMFISVHLTVFTELKRITDLYGFEIIKIFDMFPDPYPEFQTNDKSCPTDPELKVVQIKKKKLTQ
jgi:16S rRNA G966 N2-methylase RsmD